MLEIDPEFADALAAATVSIMIMEIVDNAFVLFVPGAMEPA